MRIKGIYADKPAIFQALVLLVFILTGAIVSSTLSIGAQALTYGLHSDISSHPGLMRVMQLISAIGIFLLPALLTAWTCSEHPMKYLSIKKEPNKKAWFLVYLSIPLLSPSISLLGLLNKQMRLPAFMAPIEEWMRTQEDLMERLTTIMIGDGDIGTILANLVVVAVAAGVTEEFLFRGALQRIIGRWTSNHHVVIWGAAILFSAFHLQFYGFLPRMILGAYFGYLLYWSKSIWLPVFAHFTNNAIAVIGMSDSRLNRNELVTGDILPENILQFCLLTALTLIFFIFVNQRLYKLWSHKERD